MISLSPKLVTTKALAADLHLTPRRVRQLIRSRVFPEPETESGEHDLQVCRQRYRLFIDEEWSGREWADFVEQLGQDATNADRLIDRALTPKSTLRDLQKAAAAVRRLFSNLYFTVAVRSRHDGEREFHMGVWTREEVQTMRPLLWRLCEHLGEQRGTSAQEIADQLNKEMGIAA